MSNAIKYKIPDNWIIYNLPKIMMPLIDAKVAIETLKNLPQQRSWVENLQEIELKREIAGTSKIEGADFTEKEFEVALSESPDQLLTRSQKQAHAAKQAYNFIAKLPLDFPIDEELIHKIHRIIVKDADDDHCNPGTLRGKDDNVTYGQPRHRGAVGGRECKEAFSSLVQSIQTIFKKHDPLIQALAAHYHLAAIHPYQDGNGRTTRGLEALMLQRAGLKDICFVPMSNYYYDEKNAYLSKLAETRAMDHDLTSFIIFGLEGIKIQTSRIANEIIIMNQKGLYRNFMYDLFKRLKNKKRRVIESRQIEFLKILLEINSINHFDAYSRLEIHYINLRTSFNTYIRDVNQLIHLGAVNLTLEGDIYTLHINLNWPMEMSETELYEKLKNLPKAKSTKFL